MCLLQSVQNQGIVGYDPVIFTAQLPPPRPSGYILGIVLKKDDLNTIMCAIALSVFCPDNLSIIFRNLSYSTRFRMWYVSQSFCLKVSPEICTSGLPLRRSYMTLSWKISTHSNILFTYRQFIYLSLPITIITDC